MKIPQGILTSAQLRSTRGRGDQLFARVRPHHDAAERTAAFRSAGRRRSAMRALAETGLTTREACGNSVRNITACPYAGVAEGEIFDVTPYAEAMTRYFLRHPLSASLPRKFKIAFEGCPEDHAVAAIHDIGWRARIVNGRRGFRVTVGGGTAILVNSGSAAVRLPSS